MASSVKFFKIYNYKNIDIFYISLFCSILVSFITFIEGNELHHMKYPIIEIPIILILGIFIGFIVMKICSLYIDKYAKEKSDFIFNKIINLPTNNVYSQCDVVVLEKNIVDKIVSYVFGINFRRAKFKRKIKFVIISDDNFMFNFKGKVFKFKKYGFNYCIPLKFFIDRPNAIISENKSA